MRTFRLRMGTALLPFKIAYSLRVRDNSLSAFFILYRLYKLLLSIALKRRVSVEIPLQYNGCAFSLCVGTSADLAVIREIFLDNEYKHPLLTNPKTIFDVGANIGAASIYFHCLYPDAIIYAFEPDEVLFSKLEKHTSSFSNIRPVKAALSDVNGVVTFFSSPNRPLSGSVIDRTSEEPSQEVISYSISGFAATQHIISIDLLKFDIEGGEVRLFSKQQDRLLARCLIGEVHLDLLSMGKSEFTVLFPEFTYAFVRETMPERYIFFAEQTEILGAVN